MRVESPHPCRSAKIGGWFHDLPDKVLAPRPKAKCPPPKMAPPADFTELACRYAAALVNADVPAQELGVSARSLERLQAGYTGTGYSFPMRDAAEKVIGIRIRARDGRKWCVPGSQNGLFWPEGVDPRHADPLLLPEGPTSCAACLDLGYAAIGRPNCEARIDLISGLAEKCRGQVVLLADHDEAHARKDGSVYFPGQDGAAKIAQAIRPLVKTLRVVKPPFHKDAREWLRAGATRDVVDCVIKSARFWQ